MLANIIPLLVSMQNVTICLEKVLEKANFDAVALVHLNKTVDYADKVYEQLVNDTNYVWMRFNMDNNATLIDNHILENNFLEKIFFVYVLDRFSDWIQIYEFIVLTKLNYRENQIYIVDQYPTSEELIKMGRVSFMRGFYNVGVLFWNSTGHGSGLEAYTFNGFEDRARFIIKIPVVNDRCDNNISNQIFFEKERNFHGNNLTFYGHTEPPGFIRTVGIVNGQKEYSIAGHDVLITEVISKQLNAYTKYKLALVFFYMINTTYCEIIKKPKDNVEEKIISVGHIERYDWQVPQGTSGYISIYTKSGFDMNSQQMSYKLYYGSRRIKDISFLYPHDTDNFIIVVAKRLKSRTEYKHLLKSPLFIVWGPVTIVVAMLRWTFNKLTKTNKTISEIYLQTFGLSLAVSFNMTKASGAEKLLLWWFCLGTMLSGMILSSSMFQGFAIQTDPTINNLKELEMSGLEIQLPAHVELAKNFFENIPCDLKLIESPAYTISQMISDRNTSYAYVIRERKFNFMFEDSDFWHVVKRFGFQHLSYKLHFYSALENRMNIVIQRCVDHGIVKYLLAKSQRHLTGSRAKVPKVVSEIVKPLSVHDIKDVYLLYTLGIVLSSIVFIAEGIYGRKKTN